jgi:hypothetical protein
MVTRPRPGFDGAAACLLSRSGTYPWIVSKHSLTPKWSYFWIGGDSAGMPNPGANRVYQDLSSCPSANGPNERIGAPVVHWRASCIDSVRLLG